MSKRNSMKNVIGFSLSTRTILINQHYPAAHSAHDQRVGCGRTDQSTPHNPCFHIFSFLQPCEGSRPFRTAFARLISATDKFITKLINYSAWDAHTSISTLNAGLARAATYNNVLQG